MISMWYGACSTVPWANNWVYIGSSPFGSWDIRPWRYYADLKYKGSYSIAIDSMENILAIAMLFNMLTLMVTLIDNIHVTYIWSSDHMQ